MDHERIAELNLIDQYLLGKLSANEVEEFEAHFVDCAECIEQLKISRSFIHGLKAYAAQEPIRPITDSSVPRRPWFMGRFKPLRIAAATALVIMAVGGFFGVRRFLRLEAQLRQARQETADITEKYRKEVGNSAESEAKNQQDKQQLTQQVGELQKKLDQLTGPAGQVPPPGQGPDVGPDGSGVNFPIFVLASVVRGEDPNATNITLTNTTSRFALSIPIEDQRDFAGYRIKIVDRQGKSIWNHDGFKPDRYHALSMVLSSSLVPDGSYQLSVEGMTAPGQWTIVGNYPFRVARTARG